MAAREATMGGMAAIRSTFYNVFLKRNSMYVATCVVAGFLGTNAYLSITDTLWKSINKGVRWKFIEI